MKKKLSLIDKMKIWWQKKRDQNSGEADFDADQLPEDLKQQLQYSADDEEEDEDEDFVPQTMTLSPQDFPLEDEDEENLDETNPSYDRQELDKTREMDADRIQAIRDNAYSEDDFEEHSGINSFNEFQIPKAPKGRQARFTRMKKQLATGFARLRKGKSNKTKNNALTWDQFITLLFAPQSRARIHRYFLLSTIVVGTYSLGKIIALVLTAGQTPTPNNQMILSPPVVDASSLQQDLQTVARIDLFNSKREASTPTKPEQPKIDETLVCVSSNQATSLPIKLVNTVVLQDSVKSIAAVQVRNGRELVSVREGQKIANLAEVGKIDRLKLVVKNLSNGQCEFIQPEEPRTAARRGAQPNVQIVSPEQGQRIIKEQQNSGIVNEGTSFKIQKGFRDQMLSNISEVLTQARAVQIQNPDGSMAFKMTEIVPGSIYSQLNIMDGDIIEGINGSNITNLNEVMTMFGRIREIDNLSLTIRRNGVSQSYDYSFE